MFRHTLNRSQILQIFLKKRSVSIYVVSHIFYFVLINISCAKRQYGPIEIHVVEHSWRECNICVTSTKLLRTRQSAKYLGDRVLARTIDNVVHRPFATDVIHTDELEKTRVDEAHAHAVPHVHGSQVRNDGQRPPEASRRSEKVEHRCYTWNTINTTFSLRCFLLCIF